jgi:hypothetical protein
MGCVFGTAGNATRVESVPQDLKMSYLLKINEKCPHIRLDHCDVPKILPIECPTAKYNLKYCYVSQRGYYPNGRKHIIGLFFRITSIYLFVCTF